MTRLAGWLKPERWTDRVRRPSPFRLFALATAIGMIAIGGGSLIASQRAGEAEAFNDVRSFTRLIATTVVEPNVSQALLDESPTAQARMDSVVDNRVLDENTIRVKLWNSDGKIVYSDEPDLIGEIYELSTERLDSLRTGRIVSIVSPLEGNEHRYEAAVADEMLQVYLPIDGPGGEPLLYEAYFPVSAISDSASRIRTIFVPIILGALVLMGGMQLVLGRDLSRRMSRAQEERERLLQRAIDSSQIERRRIAADIHDGVVQDLVATSLSVAAAAESAGSIDRELSSDLQSAAVGTRRSLQSLRSLLVEIYPPNLYDSGLESALTDLLAPAETMGIVTELTIVGEPDTSRTAVTLVYRVAQETVRNVIRHAEAASLTVAVDATDENVTLTIVDDGQGFSPAEDSPDGHFGLRILRDLAADAGAQLDVDSRPGEGTTVRLEVRL